MARSSGHDGAMTRGMATLAEFGAVGLAFFLWDMGVKRGDLPVLGAASYAAPLLSTLVLIAADRAEATGVVWTACALIKGRAALAAKEMILRR